MMLDNLPGWVIDDCDSVRLEAEPFREMTPEQRAVLVKAACRAMARLLQIREDRKQVLEYVDPIPEGTVRALERLRREASRSR